MRVKYANKVFQVLYTKEVAGLTMYAVEDEPNHVDWLVNVEEVDFEKKELKKIEQKPTWSEEDEEMLENIIICADKDYFICKEHIDWLKSLKDRLQPKQEWSKEDENTIKFLISHFCSCHPTRTFQFTINEVITHDELLRKIRHLKSQSTWKPSDEQMDALHYVTNFDYGGHKATLVSLYEQLKKLKG